MLVSNALVEFMDEKACVDRVYTDLSRAFDSTSQIKSIHKLSAGNKINSYACDWVEHFLSNRLEHMLF